MPREVRVDQVEQDGEYVVVKAEMDEEYYMAAIRPTRVNVRPTPTPRPIPTPTSTPTPQPTNTVAPTATFKSMPAPAPTTAPAPTIAAPAQSGSLRDVAAKLAGGPGAIYVGDLAWLAGPAPTSDQGDINGNVPLDSIQRHRYVYESDYYKGLLEKARFTDPTPLTSRNMNIQFQHACVSPSLLPCKLMESYFAPNLLKRTNGQINLHVVSYPELGLAGPDTLWLIGDGILGMGNVYSRYVAGELPGIEIQNLPGMFASRQAQFDATTAIMPDLERMVSDATDGGIVINQNWLWEADEYLFSQKPLRTQNDFEGMRTLSTSAALTDWINGMGAKARFVAFAEVHLVLELGVLDAGSAWASSAHGQRWYEVTAYMNGPLLSLPSSLNVLNREVWEQMPSDLRQILIEEGARAELEALRLAAVQKEMGVARNVQAGMELVSFSQAIQDHSFRVLMQRVIPNWVSRVGGPSRPIIQIFNEKVGPLVGLEITPDGSVIRR